MSELPPLRIASSLRPGGYRDAAFDGGVALEIVHHRRVFGLDGSEALERDHVRLGSRGLEREAREGWISIAGAGDVLEVIIGDFVMQHDSATGAARLVHTPRSVQLRVRHRPDLVPLLGGLSADDALRVADALNAHLFG